MSAAQSNSPAEGTVEPFSTAEANSPAPQDTQIPENTHASEPRPADSDPSTGSRFIESGLIEATAEAQDDPPTENIENEDVIPLLHNPLAPPLAPSEIDSDTTGTLPSILFVIPFPAPKNANRGKETPPFLLYSPPRASYIKPPKLENGKRGKEKLVKKITRKWQEEVAKGEEIKRGNIPNPTRFAKVRGGAMRAASTISKWLPSSCIETLSRLPKREKIGDITLIHPMFSQSEVDENCDDSDLPYEPTEDDLRNDFGVLLRKTRKRVLVRAIISGILLPISLGIEAFVPVFTFEINLTYFAFQIYGLRKAKAIAEGPKVKKPKRSKRSKKSKKNKSFEETALLENDESPEQEVWTEPKSQPPTLLMQPIAPPTLDPVLTLLYRICAKYDPVSFPPLPGEEENEVPTSAEDSSAIASSEESFPISLKKPGTEVSKDLIRLFRENLPEEVAARHLLDENLLAEDLARYMKKASKEYIDSLKGRKDRSGVIFSFKRWRKDSAKKSVVKKELKKAKVAEKKIAKQKAKEEKKAKLKSKDIEEALVTIPVLQESEPVPVETIEV